MSCHRCPCTHLHLFPLAPPPSVRSLPTAQHSPCCKLLARFILRGSPSQQPPALRAMYASAPAVRHPCLPPTFGCLPSAAAACSAAAILFTPRPRQRRGRHSGRCSKAKRQQGCKGQAKAASVQGQRGRGRHSRQKLFFASRALRVAAWLVLAAARRGWRHALRHLCRSGGGREGGQQARGSVGLACDRPRERKKATSSKGTRAGGMRRPA